MELRQKVKRYGLGALAMLALAIGTTSCGAANQPDSLSDDEQQRLVQLVQQHGSDIEDPSCQVETFRIEGSTVYGWATCTDTHTEQAMPTSSAESFPFKIDGDKVQRPRSGSDYTADVHSMFPQDLWDAIAQHTSGN